MKKQLWILRKLFRSIRSRSILLWIQVFILSLVLNFCLIHPLSTIIGYSTYAQSGLENVGVFTVGYQFIEWENKDDSPAYNQLTQELSQLGEVGEINECIALLPDFSDDLLSLIVYPKGFVERVSLPIPGDSTVLRYNHRPKALPLVLDSRLRNACQIGQETTIIVDAVQYPAYVAGFMGENNEYFGVPYASSSPTLDNLLRAGEQNYHALTVKTDILPDSVLNKTHSALYIFPPLGEYIDAYLPMWQHAVKTSWLGNVYSLSDMCAEQVRTELIGSSFELYLACIWCIALFLVGLQGFFTYIMTRMHRQLAVYRMLGMTRVRWMFMMVVLIFLPVLICAMAGSFLANSVGFEQIDRVSTLLITGTVLFSLACMSPAMIMEIRSWRKNITELYNKEARI